MIMYRNPLEQWFWEGGWMYVGGVMFIFGIVFSCYLLWCDWQMKIRRKQSWQEMPENRRRAWREYSRLNNQQLEEWEK